MHYLFSDGGSRGNPGASAVAALLFDHQNKLVDITAKYTDTGTNNRAEYLALLNGLRMVKKNGIKEVICSLDSELVVKQLNREYKVKDSEIQKLFDLIQEEIKNFKTISFKHIPREENSFADKLVNIILDNISANDSK